MHDYALYLESGPQRKKTMVHVLELAGCIANGPTTEAALDATPEAIRAFRRFVARHGEDIDAGAEFTTHVAEHIAETGRWLGNGSPYANYAPDEQPLTPRESEVSLARFMAIRETLAAWAGTQSAAALDATPADGGRPARAILLHVLGPTGANLSTSLGGARGFSALHTQAEGGTVDLGEALLTSAGMAADMVRAATPEQRRALIEKDSGDRRTLRKSVRFLLEHDWEHLAELSRRKGGPAL
ncbi:MAG: hypothetical protein WD800_05400 [Dehalococcoidia bacterium]